MSSNSRVVVGLLAGLAVGAAMGILFAPERGTETRERISDALQDLGQRIKDLASSGWEEVSDRTEEMTNA